MALLALIGLIVVVLFIAGGVGLHLLIWVAIAALVVGLILAVARRPWVGSGRYWW